jgi:hypothetical protein
MDLRIAESIGKISRRFRKPAGGIRAFMICGFPEPGVIETGASRR